MVNHEVNSEVNKGKELFIKKCAFCHTTQDGGENKVGPNLFGIMGKQAGTVPGFAYSNANKNLGLTWSAKTMHQFLEKPKGFMPGTKMPYPEIKERDDRNALIAYLDSLV